MLHGDLALAYLGKHMFQEANSEIQKAIELSGKGGAYVAVLALIHTAAGRRTEALETLESLIHPSDHTDDVPVEVAAVYAALGDRDRAFTWLERAYDQRAYLLGALEVDPRLDPLRSDPRLGELERRVRPPSD